MLVKENPRKLRNSGKFLENEKSGTVFGSLVYLIEQASTAEQLSGRLALKPFRYKDKPYDQ